MIRFHEKCIFCYAELPHPDLRKGEGEHVIPKNILGIWQSADICKDCKQHFGDGIDDLPFYNTPMIDAVHALDLPNKEAFTEKVKYKGKDVHTGQEKRMFKQKGQVKINVTERDTMIEVPDGNILNVGLPKVKLWYKGRYDADLIEQELLKLKPAYEQAEENSIISSDKIPLSLRKTSVSNIEVDKDSLRNLTPLIAKIAVFALSYTYTYEGLKRITNYQDIVNHARYNKPIPEYTIEFVPPQDDKQYFKKHHIKLQNFGRLGLMEISLLGYPTWRVSLHYSEDVVLHDENGNELVWYGWAFDCESRTHYHGRKLKGAEKSEYIPVDF